MPELQETCERLRREGQDLAVKLAAMEAQFTEERKGAAEKLALMEDAKTRLTDAFHALSAEALRKNNQSFLELAKETLGTFQESAKGDLEQRQQAINEVVKPVRESLAKVDAQITELEKNRVGAYESLQAQVRSMLETQQQLRSETGNLVKALRAPNVRGRWGEVQLRRVVEMAGMVDHCDFFEQQTVTGGEGELLRPDLLVKLPGEKTIVVDAKAPVVAYLDALEAADDTARGEQLARHAAHVRAHIEALSRKAYWEQFNPTPEFVVLFLPGEMFFSAALERDPTLIEFGAEKRVILATPTTLIALLKAIFFGWRQQKLTKNAQEISDLGRELYARLSTMGGHMGRLGSSLAKSVESYNQAVASLETRVLVKARAFRDLEAGAPNVEIETLEPVEQASPAIAGSGDGGREAMKGEGRMLNRRPFEEDGAEISVVPAGLGLRVSRIPRVKTRGYGRASLRDFFGNGRVTGFICGAFVFLAVCLAGCSKTQPAAPAAGADSPSPSPSPAPPKKLLVLATSAPMYCFAKNVAGELADVEMIKAAGTEVSAKGFAPSAEAGGEGLRRRMWLWKTDLDLKDWIDRLVAKGLKPGAVRVDSRREGRGRGFRGCPGDPDTPPGDAPADPSKPADPHVWLDPLMAIKEVQNIRDALMARDPANADKYLANENHYEAALRDLDDEVGRTTVDIAKRRLLCLGQAFTYFLSRYEFPIAKSAARGGRRAGARRGMIQTV